MEIRLALEKTGMAKRNDWANTSSYVHVVNFRLVWKGTNEVAPHLDNILDNNWSPHHPETDCPCGCREEKYPKCEACQWIARCPKETIDDEYTAWGREVILYRLKRDCTCKED